MSDLIPYKGAYLYEVTDGWEANYKGFHYDAKTIDELKAKIDKAIKSEDDQLTLNLFSATKDHSRVIFEDVDEGDDYEVVFQFDNVTDEYDDLDSIPTTSISVQAETYSDAVKYAQQYLRKMQKDETADEKWLSASIQAIELR